MQGFEMLQMGDDEGVHEYISRVVTIINQIQTLGHRLAEPKVVSMVVWSLAHKFNFVVVAIKIPRRYQNSHFITLVALCKLTK